MKNLLILFLLALSISTFSQNLKGIVPKSLYTIADTTKAIGQPLSEGNVVISTQDNKIWRVNKYAKDTTKFRYVNKILLVTASGEGFDTTYIYSILNGKLDTVDASNFIQATGGQNVMGQPLLMEDDTLYLGNAAVKGQYGDIYFSNNCTGDFDVEFWNTLAGQSTQLTVRSNTSSGFWGAFSSTHQYVITRDKFVVGANSDASGVLLLANSPNHKIEIISNTDIDLDGTVKLTNTAEATTDKTLYYNTTTKEVSYGAALSGTLESVIINDRVADINTNTGSIQINQQGSDNNPLLVLRNSGNGANRSTLRIADYLDTTNFIFGNNLFVAKNLPNISTDSILSISSSGNIGWRAAPTTDTTAIYAALDSKADTGSITDLSTRITNDSIALLSLETRYETDSIAKNSTLATKWTQGGDSIESGSNDIGTTDNTGIDVITNNTKRMEVLSTGQVSIGDKPTGGNVARLVVTSGTLGTANHGISVSDNYTINTNKLAVISMPNYASNGDRPNFTLISGSSAAASNSLAIGGGLTGSVYAATSISLFTGTTISTSEGTRRMLVNSSGNISFSNGATAAPTPTYNLSMASGAAATWGIEPSASGAGVAWTLRGSGAATGATDGNGGMFTAAYGKSTGTGFGSFRVTRYSRAISTGTADNTESDAMIIPSSKLMSDNTSTDLFNVACALGTSAGVTVEYTIKTVGGAGNESHTEIGTVYMMASNDGSITTTISKVTSVQHKSDAGTYTVTFAASAANPSVISVTADTDLNVNSVIHYNIINKDAQVINQL